MERQKPPRFEKKPDRPRAEPLRQTAPLAPAAGPTPEASSAGLADVLFDLHLDEKQGGRPDEPPTGLAGLTGLERLIAILGPCAIPGCDVHLLSRDRNGTELEILHHLTTDAPIEPALADARRYWSASPHPAAVAVLVYTDGERVLMVDGTEVPLR